jgi:integrase
MRFEDFTMDFYKDFLHYCNHHKQYKPNTIKNLLADIKSMLRRAWNQGLHNNLDYLKFKKPSELPDTIYLNVVELDRIMKVVFPPNEKNIEVARDLFIVACWTGLRFSDWTRLGQIDFSGQFFSVTTRKTRQTVTLPVFPAFREILNKYNGKLPQPPRSNATLNTNIRAAVKKAGLTEMITFSEVRGGKSVTKEVPKFQRVSSHTARRSFATNLYNMGVPPIDIMKLTGHMTEVAFMRYLRITSADAASRILDIFNNQINTAGNK